MNETEKDTLVGDALRALLYEVSVNPKPGLVDPVSSGPHPDMDVFSFIDSAMSLRVYFNECVEQGASFQGNDLRELFLAIRPAGVEAEKAMFQATQGVNTHKGAIFSLGILVTADAYQSIHNEFLVQQIVQLMLKDLTVNDFKGLADKAPEALTAGEKEYLTYGIKGIRGEAEAGFPTVMTIGLPALRKHQGTTNQRLLDTLMTIVGNGVDTNLVKRAQTNDIVHWAHEQSERYFALGGSRTVQGMAFLDELNEIFNARNLSLGGSADLLILTIFMGLREGII